MFTVHFYTRENCKLCEEAYVLLEVLQHKYKFQIEERDIESNDDWLETYQVIIPVIEIDDIVLNGDMITIEKIENSLKKRL